MSNYTCNDCDYSTSDRKNNQIWCGTYHTYVDCDSAPRCKRLTVRGNLKGSQDPCFLTTAMCDILGYPDSNFYLNAMRFLRDNYVKKEVDCYDLLEEYKKISPSICKGLKESPFKEETALTMKERYIIPIIKDIDSATQEGNNKYFDNAVDKYIEMTNTLYNAYYEESPKERVRK